MCLLCGHSDVGAGDSVRSHILLSMIFESWDHNPGIKNKLLYDVDTLKDVCGCLITISNQAVALAHFTVREFLYSPRLWNNSNNSIRFFALSSDIVRTAYIKTTLSGAISYNGPFTKLLNWKGDLFDYLLLFGVLAMLKWKTLIRAELQALVFD